MTETARPQNAADPPPQTPRPPTAPVALSAAAPLVLDASYGEGGGQVLRTALALAVALGRTVMLKKVRARRPKPGLQPQHLTVVRSLAAISGAEVLGDHLGSTELSFAPRGLAGGEYHFDIGSIKGSAGSVSLLFEALLLPLALAPVASRLALVGGTHVPWSPPVHYLTEVFLPALRTTGIEAALTLRRWGWYPAGGGHVTAIISPSSRRGGFVGTSSPVATIVGVSAVSRLPRSIAERQRRRAEERLAAAGLAARITIEEDTTALGPGTLLLLAVPGRAGFSALGRRGLPAERVADAAVDELLAWVESHAAIDDRLADQLLPFLALAQGPSIFTCSTLSSHLTTVAWVVRQFASVEIRLHEGPPARVEIVP
jgi:RNA 3'-terminal phosphate cyclase (ATP)